MALIEGVLTGGCQCGAVRFQATAREDDAHVCHCRMCQRAVGGPFAVLVPVPLDRFAWTRGAPATFRSSAVADRDFCAACGTPLSYRPVGGRHVALTAGSLDDPSLAPPIRQDGNESRLPWTDGLPHLPGREGTTEGEDPARAALVATTSRQG